MHRSLLGIVAVLVAANLLAAADLPAPDEVQAPAKALIEALAKGDFAAACKDFDPEMKKALPAEKLEATWKSLIEQVGKLQKTGEIRSEKSGKYVIARVPCVFEKMTLDMQVTFTADKQVTGLFFRPPSGSSYKLPTYAKPDRYREVEVTVGSGEWALPGTLTLPVGEGPFPAVVLVHGSGPNDRDETVGANRPFRDLASGLASRGVAVLRYDKRTLKYGAQMVKAKEPFTVKEEVIDDAVLAAALLRKTKEVDPKRVFILGHSLGATLAPRIGDAAPDVAGLILLAAAARPLEDLLLEQIAYLMSLKGDLADVDKEQLATLKRQVARIKDPKLSPDTPTSELPLGQTAAYWLSLRGSPVETATKLGKPMLVLQGERDYQVTMEDFRLWKEALGKSKNAELKSYPKLNHLFEEGEGKSKPEEYDKAGHVAEEVVDDIVAWIKKR